MTFQLVYLRSEEVFRTNHTKFRSCIQSDYLIYFNNSLDLSLSYYFFYVILLLFISVYSLDAFFTGEWFVHPFLMTDDTYLINLVSDLLSVFLANL